MEQAAAPKQIYLLLKEIIQKMSFYYFHFDNELILNRESREIIDFVKNEYYFKQRYKSKYFYSIKKFIFDLDYKAHPDKYPDLIYKDNIKIENLSHAVPGNSIEANLLIGYFKEIKSPDGVFFTNFFGGKIQPINQELKSIINDLKTIIESIKTAENKSTEQLQVIEINCQDLENIYSICNFIEDSYLLSRSSNIPPLKSGHLISFIGGLYGYIKDLEILLTEYGLAVVSLNNEIPPVKKIRNFKERLEDILICFSIDLVSPLFSSMNCKIEYIEGRVRLTDIDELERDIFSRIFDYFLDLFEYGNNKKIRTGINYSPQTGGISSSNIISDKPSVSKITPSDNDKKVPEERIIDSRFFIELYTALAKFIERLKFDLAPIVNEKGEILHHKLGFNQFDVPDHARSTNFEDVILPGKISPKETANYRTSDQMIIKSTYWLYDRIATIIKYYRISKEGIILDKARLFIDDVKTLFLPSKNEYNDIRVFGTFTQFKINLKRLCTSTTGQSKYLNRISYIAELLDAAKKYLLKEEEQKSLD